MEVTLPTSESSGQDEVSQVNPWEEVNGQYDYIMLLSDTARLLTTLFLLSSTFPVLSFQIHHIYKFAEIWLTDNDQDTPLADHLKNPYLKVRGTQSLLPYSYPLDGNIVASSPSLYTNPPFTLYSC